MRCPAHRGKDRRHCRKRLRRAADHDRQFTRCRAFRAAAHRRIQIRHAGCQMTFGVFHRFIGTDRTHVNPRRPFGDRRGRALLKHYLGHRRAIGKHGDHHTRTGHSF